MRSKPGLHQMRLRPASALGSDASESKREFRHDI
jgi:hypothetical protein